MFERRIEEAALNSWPALQQLMYDGWFIRFAQGYTKRANSVTPIYQSLLPIEEKIAHCERFYEAKHLPTIFRLPSFSAESYALDQLLVQRNYHSLDHTCVYSARLDSSPMIDNLVVRCIPLATWFALYCQFSTRYMELQHLHLELLERIPHPPMYAVFYQAGSPVACGLGVLEHEALGLFDIVTDPAQRRKGYGTQLVMGMLALGKQQGAEYAYLQVMNTNYAAQQMYAKLGFQECYHYWYRQQAQ